MGKETTKLEPEDPEHIGGWKLEGRIGKGGFGTIYLGTKKGNRAALKLIGRESLGDQESIPRFANEVRNLNVLNHPGIPKLIEHNLNKITPSVSPFIAVEYFEGPTLQALIDQKKPITEQLWLEYFESLIETLMYCHESGIIHRDISPSNIILTTHGPKLIDFGLSYLKGSERLSQQIELTIGTPPFRSPEHYHGEPIDAMDVFSLASVFKFAASGKYPFSAEQESRYTDKISFETPDLKGLTEIQKTLLTPLFYKDSNSRATLKDLKLALSELRSKNQINSYKTLLKNSQSKLKNTKREMGPRRKLIQFASGVIVALIISSGFIYLISNQNAEASECKRLYQSRNFTEAIKVCGLDVSQGKLESQVTLGRAFKAIKQEDRAKEIFLSCKDTNFECLMENAYFLSDPEQARADWIKAFENGISDAGVALAISYNKSNDTTSGNLWMEKALEKGSQYARFMKVASLTSNKQYKEAIELAKRLINVDLTAYPGMAAGLSMEELIVWLYERDNDLEGKIQFLEECSKYNGACIGSLANNYWLNGDYVNAEKWALKGSGLNDAVSLQVLGDLEKRKIVSVKDAKSSDLEKMYFWYERAAKAGDVPSMVSVADWKSEQLKTSEACLWWNRIITVINDRKDSFMEQNGDKKWAENSANKIQKFQCGNSATSGGSTSPSPRPTKKAESLTQDAVPTPTMKQPLMSYSGFGYSEELAPNVKVSSIFGRAFLGSNGVWKIPITNDKLESVPPINRVQFKNASEPFGSWWNIGYQIKKDTFGSYAEVSELGLQLLFAKDNEKVCPEFRVAIVENNLVTYIWNKSVQPCSVN
jgi:serine/threonine protein kinase